MKAHRKNILERWEMRKVVGYYELSFVTQKLQIQILKSWVLVPQNVTILDMGFNDIIKLKWGHMDGA
jgi:hypothetical protein